LVVQDDKLGVQDDKLGVQDDKLVVQDNKMVVQDDDSPALSFRTIEPPVIPNYRTTCHSGLDPESREVGLIKA